MPGKRAPDRRGVTFYWPLEVLDDWRRSCADRGETVAGATLSLVVEELRRRRGGERDGERGD